MSQVDIPPTLLGLLGISYTSRFYGQDLFALEPGRERAFIGNYQKLGYLRNDRLIQLGPKRVAEEVIPSFDADRAQPLVKAGSVLVKEAVGLLPDGQLPVSAWADEEGGQRQSRRHSYCPA